jgi:NAD(P)-dependent dehydrogenase (short-subunit alcohol dehydrogenase family)
MEAFMQILLTGGSGSVGKAVIERLVRSGYAVRVIGRRPDLSFEGAEYQVCDINDYPRLREAIRGCQAVVHLAAIPSPDMGTPQEIFHINAQGTFNVFQAATEEGIRRVVQASSINATGQFYGVVPAPLNYLPMDEEHPPFSTDAYSFSKHVIEDIGDYFWRREGITSLAYRLPWVAPATVQEYISKRRSFIQELVEDLLKRSPEARRSWFDMAWKSYNDFRATRPYEVPIRGYAREKMNEFPEEQRAAIGAMSQRVNFFTMLDERDSAQAFEKGLTAEFTGSQPLFVNDSLNWTGVESHVLAELFYPDVKQFKKELKGRETVISIDKARQLIGFEPEFSFGK